jgi:hypothetical protein
MVELGEVLRFAEVRRFFNKMQRRKDPVVAEKKTHRRERREKNLFSAYSAPLRFVFV